MVFSVHMKRFSYSFSLLNLNSLSNEIVCFLLANRVLEYNKMFFFLSLSLLGDIAHLCIQYWNQHHSIPHPSFHENSDTYFEFYPFQYLFCISTAYSYCIELKFFPELLLKRKVHKICKKCLSKQIFEQYD